MSRVVISQPFYFPWVGLFEQIRLADVFAHADDVAFTKGSFVNRVQIKTASGILWLSIPLRHPCAGHPIGEVLIDDTDNWRKRQLGQLQTAYARAPFRDDMLAMVRDVFDAKAPTIFDLCRASIASVCRYFSLANPDEFRWTSQLHVVGGNTQRALDLVLALGGTTYITGHGAKNYLDHEAFERAGVQVEYMNYARTPYPQLHGAFDPHVSILDLIANVGREGVQYIHSTTLPWREFLATQGKPT